MTAAIKVDHRSVPGKDLTASLVQLLSVRASDINDLAQETGYSVSCVRRRLYDLEKAGTTYRERVITMTGYMYRWHLGEAPAFVPESDEGPAMRQAIVRKYPAVNKRDWLQAAFFGPTGTRPALVLEMEH